jgi:hypothetical protein
VVLMPRCWHHALREIREATAAKEQGTPRRARISRNTIAQGRPVVSAALLWPGVRKSAFSLHARLAGAASIRSSLRPPSFEGETNAKLGHILPRECGRTSSPLSCPARAGR